MAQLGSLADALIAIKASGRRFYVYVMHRHDGTPFYVGKGQDIRISRHEWDAINTQRKCHRLAIVRKHQREGIDVLYQVTGCYDVEAEAFAKERELIAQIGRYDLGLGPLTNKTDGGEGAANPPAHVTAKRSEKMRQHWQDPRKRDAWMQSLAQAQKSDLRKAKVAAALRTDEFRAAKAEAMAAAWKSDEFRNRVVAAIRVSQGDSWRLKQAAGVKRVQDDPEFHKRRNEAFRSPEVRAKCAAIASDPKRRSEQSKNAKAQRARQEEARRRVLKLADERGCVDQLPNHRSGLSTWLALEAQLLSKGP
jgi:hypothetical protein